LAPLFGDLGHTVNIYRMIIGCLYVNADEIPTTGKSCSLYWELLHPILGIPLASIGKLPFIGKLPIGA
jgi:hypothetical protein